MTNIEILDMERPTYYVDFPWRVTTSTQRLNKFAEWLNQTPGSGYSVGSNGIYFYSESDAVLFALRWS